VPAPAAIVSLPRYARHLVVRFFGALTARPLRPAEQDEVAGLLRPEEARLFFRQSAADQRHALEVARRVRVTLADDAEALTAALLHDVGKIESGLGPVARSLATLAELFRLPLPPRWRSYREHGPRGAARLERIGACRLAVDFARHGSGARPAGVDEARWAALVDADNA
jgi:hypothetical protein